MYINICKSFFHKKLGIHPHPHFITFLVTWRCNCKCIFCDIWKKEDIRNNELNIDDIEYIFADFKELDVLRITGGEPFLRSDLDEIINIIDRIANPHIIHITSNGLMTKNILNCIEKINNKKKLHIKISIDEIGNKHDAIRGVKGIYDFATTTTKELAKIARSVTGFTVGINQALTSPKALDAYTMLKNEFSPLGVKVYPVIAHTSGNALYGPQQKGATSVDFEPFGTFTKNEMIQCLNTFCHDSECNTSYLEKVVDRYYQRGLRNRLLYKKHSPNPPCVALKDHLRILPDGNVPICYFNDKILGCLRKTPWSELRKAPEVHTALKWISTCPGCWESCEVIPSAVYTGDIIYGCF